MRTDQAHPSQQPAGDPRSRDTWRRRWRIWRPFVVKPLRRGILLFALALVIEYLVVPELVGASKNLNLLGGVNPGWLVAGLVLEGLSLFCYGLLTQALLPPAPTIPACPGCSASTWPPRRSRTSSRPAHWAAPGSATACSLPKASRATTPRS